jgi:hypothetical protein
MLFKHQKFPLNFLKRCKEQHGMILAHYMGTGKTLTALEIVKELNNKNVIVATPHGLANQWVKEINQVEGLNDFNFRFLTYQDFLKFEEFSQEIEDAVVILDEGHHIIDVVENLLYYDERNKVKERINDKGKLDYSVTFKNVSDNRTMSFLNMFRDANKVLILSGTPFMDGIEDIRYLINIVAGKNLLPLGINEFRRNYIIDPHYNIKSLTSWIKPIIKLLSYNPYYKGPINVFIEKFLNGNLNNLSKIDAKDIVAKLKELITESFRNNKLQINSNNEDGMIKDITKSSLETITIIYIVQVLNSILKRIKKKIGYERLNGDKLKSIGRYISYYNYSIDNGELYPKIIFKTKQVGYTKEQIGIFLALYKGDYSLLTNEQMVQLKIATSYESAEFKKDFQNSPWTGLFYNGRMIGNMNTIEIPEKFKQILKSYLNNINEPTIIYSSFYNGGIRLLSTFLKQSNIKHNVYSPKLSNEERDKIKFDFENGKCNLILLHPIYYEGFSINGCKRFHILEPTMTYSRYQQLISRVVRLFSHKHLPLKDRNVKITMWLCSLENLNGIFELRKQDIEGWLKKGIAKFYTDYAVKMETSTPDKLAYDNFIDDKFFYTDLSKTLRNISIEKQHFKSC